MKKKILFVCSCLCTLLSGLFFSSSVYASSGNDTINVTQNWNTFTDQTGLHVNAYDGVVHLPYNLLNYDSNFLKSVSYSRFQTGNLSEGDSSNLYNVISVSGVVTAPLIDPRVYEDNALLVWGSFVDDANVTYSLGNDIADPNCVIVSSSTRIEFTCSYTLDNYKKLQMFDLRLGFTYSSSNSQGYAFARGGPVVLQSLTVSWTGTQDPNVALNQQRNTLLNAINNSIINSDHYQDEIDRENAKKSQLEQQSSGLGVSANNTGNPFANLFNATGCQSMPTVSGWFNHSPAFEICSPYPSGIGGVIKFVGSAVVVGLLIRLYYKKMKGGFDG